MGVASAWAEKPKANCWYWARKESSLTELSTKDKKLLGEDRLKLAAYLCYQCRGHVRDWWRIDYEYLKQRFGKSKPQLYRLVSSLRDAGLIELEVVHKRTTEIEMRYGFGRSEWQTKVWARPTASIQSKTSGFTVWADPQKFALWASIRTTRGGVRKGAGRPSKSEIIVQTSQPFQNGQVAENTRTNQKSPKSNCCLITNTYNYNNKTHTKTTQTSADQASPGHEGSSDPLESPQLLKTQTVSSTTSSNEPQLDWIAMCDAVLAQPRPPRPAPVPMPGRLILPELDDAPSETLSAPGINPDIPEPAKVEMLVGAYNKAFQEVTGKPSYVFGRFGSVTRSKLYPRLVKAAGALVEHEIAPLAWARWQLERAKKEGREKMPGIAQVFCGPLVVRWRGWFRKDYDAPSGWREHPTQAHYEQMYRRQEAVARHEGEIVGKVELYGYPVWYWEIRKREMDRDIVDPLINYPKLPKGHRI